MRVGEAWSTRNDDYQFQVPAHAGLVLTAAGIADGFTLLSTVRSGGNTANHPALSGAALSDGSLAVAPRLTPLHGLWGNAVTG